jgi:hypothetical protein
MLKSFCLWVGVPSLPNTRRFKHNPLYLQQLFNKCKAREREREREREKEQGPGSRLRGWGSAASTNNTYNNNNNNNNNTNANTNTSSIPAWERRYLSHKREGALREEVRRRGANKSLKVLS